VPASRTTGPEVRGVRTKRAEFPCGDVIAIRCDAVPPPAVATPVKRAATTESATIAESVLCIAPPSVDE
jgi:hypothetical protein